MYDLLFASQRPFQRISPLLTGKVTLVRLLALSMFDWIFFVNLEIFALVLRNWQKPFNKWRQSDGLLSIKLIELEMRDVLTTLNTF